MDPVRARLVDTSTPRRPQAVALVLHGGGSRGERVPVSPTQPSVLRMLPVAARLARVGRGRLAVRRLLNSSRGWTSRPTPVDDVRWALDEVRDELGDLPVALVGHSLGGRAALFAADDARVRSVVGLATWLGSGDTVPPTAGTDVLLVHGDSDRVARLTPVVMLVRGLVPVTRTGLVTVRGGSHALLRHRRTVDGLAARWVAATVLGDDPGPVLGPLLRGDSATAEI